MGAHHQPGILPVTILFNDGQDGFFFHHMKPKMLGWKYFFGRNPDVGSIRGELAKNQSAAGQIIGRLQ
jgi:hypothetical protein